jgi:hypothetical protein
MDVEIAESIRGYREGYGYLIDTGAVSSRPNELSKSQKQWKPCVLNSQNPPEPAYFPILDIYDGVVCQLKPLVRIRCLRERAREIVKP